MGDHNDQQNGEQNEEEIEYTPNDDLQRMIGRDLTV